MKIPYIPGLALLLLCGGCASRRYVAPARVGVDAESFDMVEQDDSTRVQVAFEVPADYLSPRSRLVIRPFAVGPDAQRVDFPQTAVEGRIYRKKRLRAARLEGEPLDADAVLLKDASRPMVVPYGHPIVLPADGGPVQLRAAVCSEGCGHVYGHDTLTVATVDLFRPVWYTAAPPAEMKMRRRQDTLALRFRINEDVLDPALGENGRQLDRMAAVLAELAADTLHVLNSLTIVGTASADGPVSLNGPLAQRRAEAVQRWLLERLDTAAQPRLRMAVDSRPEGWQPVVEAMRAADDPDAVQVQRVLESLAGQPEDRQEQRIRQLPCWPRLVRVYLPLDRRVCVTCDYTVRGFHTDAELSEAYRLRPDAMSEAELLRAAEVEPSFEGRERIYRTTLERYPRSAAAMNNLMILYRERGDRDRARALRQRLRRVQQEDAQRKSVTKEERR